MKATITTFFILLFLTHSIALACSIRDQKKVQIGVNEGIEGVCSNNGLLISCEDIGDDEISCSGPGGGYSGYDLDGLIFSACECSSQEEGELQLKKDLKE